ncbi:hypothetical protein RND81_02G183600 [Saponaria officinalis]|uniref:Aminotransferase-like plant mobile domain-containing protein n=1 Tax=Saponaria officinalis TaxID=3572 RepID=A0AAW1MNL2_SAPOF
MRGDDERFARQSEGSNSTCAAAIRKRSRGRRDDSWMLRESAPREPSDPSVIPSFTVHVAYRLYSESSYSRGVLTGRTRYGVLERLWVGVGYTQDVLDALTTTGLSHFYGCTLRCLDMVLLSAIIKRWQPDTNIFHMPFA